LTVTLDVELQSLLKNYQLSNSLAVMNNDNNIQENPVAGVDSDDLDYSKIIESLELHKTKNRFAVLSQLGQDDVIRMLYLLDKENLVLGLKFFTKEKLMSFVLSLPKSELLQILFTIFSKEDLLAMMPEKELNRLLSSDKLDKNEVYKLLQSMPTQMLAQIYEAATGVQIGNVTNDELMSKVGGLKQTQLIDGLVSLSYSQKLDFVTNMAKSDERLFTELSANSLMKAVERSTKGEMIEGMTNLDPEKIINMLTYLPENVLTQVATLIDPNKLAYVLENFYTDILAAMAGA
jgi:Mg/Co/Ni transporter MgtE